MAVSSLPLMVEIAPTPAELRAARCSDCKAPLGPTFAKAWRGVSDQGNFLIRAICVRCADREKWIVQTGKDLPAPPLYRRRAAKTLLGIALAALFAVSAGIVTGALAVAAAAAPLTLLAVPGALLYRQGITTSINVTA